jgi:hypothetical protein
MANTFKNAAVADVSNSSYDTLYAAPGSTTSVILAVALTNKTGNSVSVQVQFFDSSASATYQLLEDVSIPGNTTLEVLQGQKYILEASDALKIQSGTASAIDVVAGLMEIS